MSEMYHNEESRQLNNFQFYVTNTSDTCLAISNKYIYTSTFII